MQFLPSTWAEWGITAFGETGPPNIMNPYDAVPSAARLLCAAGAGTPRRACAARSSPTTTPTWYVTEVLALAEEYAETTADGAGRTPGAAIAVAERARPAAGGPVYGTGAC